jgi:3-isopropylmalate/(R)-2-methylmalate dehydratase small subunit
MQPFTRLVSQAAALPTANIDTDIIFPARFLLITAKAGLGRYAFYDWRFDANGAPVPGFVLNRLQKDRVQILVAGDNFGCGSSREQAPWALLDLGIRCIISSSFGEIFSNNCFKNGILPVVVSTSCLDDLILSAESGDTFEVDLASETLVRAGGDQIHFSIEGWRKAALLNGWDEVAMVLEESAADILAFEQRQRAASAWLYQRE